MPWSLWLGVWQGCTCTPTLNPTTNDETSGATAETAATTADTGPAPPCATPEVEPNDDPELTATPLPLEQYACGRIDRPGDPDNWSFVVDHDGWLQIEVDAAPGSIANMMFLLAPEFDTWRASKKDDAESLDTLLIFPAPAGAYRLTVSEEEGRGGDRYDYDLLVSEAKPQAEWTSVEVEPNDTALLPNEITSGDAVYGTFNGNGGLEDFDFYVLLVPAGRHTVHIDVNAFDVGSAADPKVTILDAEFAVVEEIFNGTTGAERDPVGSYESNGSEVLYVKLEDQPPKPELPQESPAAWYVLNLTLEAR